MSLLDALGDCGGLVRIGVVFGHKLPRLCASAHLLRMFSHVLPPFRWLYGWIVYAELLLLVAGVGFVGADKPGVHAYFSVLSELIVMMGA